MAYRFDKGTLRSPRMTADGRMVVDATISRTGVYVYRNTDGSERREYRPDSTVFDPKALQSFELKTLTQLHPQVAVGEDVAAAKQLGKGLVLEGIKRDGRHVVATFLVDDAKLFEAMRGGMSQVSCGYECDLEDTAGVTPDGERYDAIQRNIRGDHVAIVPLGRAGSASVKLDRQDAAEMISDFVHEPSGAGAATSVFQKDHFMEKLQEQLAAALKEAAEHKARADQADKDAKAARKDADDAKTALGKAESERDAARKDADDAKAAAEKSRQDSIASLPETIKARVSLERDAASVLGADAKIGDKSIADATDSDLRCAVVKKVDGVDVDVKAKGEAYLVGRFDACVGRAARGDEALGATRTEIEARKDSGVKTAEDTARSNMIARNKFTRAGGK